MTNDVILKPCPFCSGAPERRLMIGGETYIGCTQCGARIFADNDLVVVEKWNARAASEPEGNLAAVIEAHCVDLQKCIPTLEAYGLDRTTEQVRKAIDELRSALNRS